MIAHEPIIASRPGFFVDLATVARRSLRDLRRDPEAVLPPLVVATFFFAINVGAFQAIVERSAPGFDFKAFQLPTAVIFGTTGLTRANSLVIDIQSGFFDRLLVTPVKRLTLLLGLMVADLVMFATITAIVTVTAMIVGVRFETGVAGILAFIAMAVGWALAFSGVVYAIALKTGSPSAVGNSFLLFFPLAFLTTSSVPKVAMTSWLAAIVPYNPMTYVLAAQRTVISVGWVAGPIIRGLAVIGGIAVLSMGLALAALRGRTKRG